MVGFCASLFLSVVTLYFLSALFFRRVGCGQNEQLHNIECFTLLFFSFVLLLRASGARWKKLSEEEKSPFKEEARKLRHTHMQVKGVRNFVIKFEALLCPASERKHSRGVIGSRLFSLSVTRFYVLLAAEGFAGKTVFVFANSCTCAGRDLLFLLLLLLLSFFLK